MTGTAFSVDRAEKSVRIDGEKAIEVAGSSRPSFTLRTDFHRAHNPAKQASGRVWSKANQTGVLDLPRFRGELRAWDSD